MTNSIIFFCQQENDFLFRSLFLLFDKILNRCPRKRLLLEFLQRNVFAKFTRAYLCLKAISNEFSCSTIHIYRDPRAVIASLRKQNPTYCNKDSIVYI